MSDEQNNTTPATAAVDPKQTRLVKEWKYPAQLISTRWDGAGRFIYSSSTDHTIQRWDFETGAKTAFTGLDTWAGALALRQDGLLYTGTYRGDLVLWNTVGDDPKPIHTYNAAHDGWIRNASMSPDGNWMATAGNDHVVQLWSTNEPIAARKLEGHEDELYFSCFTPDSRQLVSGGLNGMMRVWDVETGEFVREIDASEYVYFDPAYRARFGGTRCIAISDDSRWLACGGVGENVFSMAGEFKPGVIIYDWETGEQTCELKAADASYWGNMRGLCFHPDGFLIGVAGGKHGGRIWFWNVDDGKETPFHEIKLPTAAKDCDFHDHKLILVALYDGEPVRQVKTEIGGKIQVYTL